jgi:hypothetical protein
MNDRGHAHELVELAQWLQRQADAKRSRVVLRQRSSARGKDERVREWSLREIHASGLAAEIYAGAIDDAKHQSGTVQYGLFAYVDGQKSSADRMLFAIENPSERERDRGRSSTALATLGGDDDVGADMFDRAERTNVVGLLMRHTHASAQLALGHIHDIVHHYKEECERKDVRIRELEERHAKVVALQEELMSAKHEREMEALKATRSEQRKDELLGRVGTLLPIAISKLMPGSKPPALGEEMVRTLLKSLTKEQIQALQAILGPDQAVLVMELYATFQHQEEKADAGKASGMNGHANGHANGAAQ